MFLSDPIHLYFSNSPKDPLGREAISGQMSFQPEQAVIRWRTTGNVFVGNTQELQAINIPYQTITEVDLEKSWFKRPQLIIRLSQPDLVANIPGVEVGKLTLEIDNRSKKDLKRLEEHIDFQKSALLLESAENRIRDLKDS